MTRTLALSIALVCGACVALAGCIGEMDPEDTEMAELGEVGVISLAITAVPPSVQCLQVIAYRAPGGVSESVPLATQSFATTSGSSWAGNVGLGSFARGTVQLTASTFNTACASIGGQMASWVADPVITNITPGQRTAVTLNFRENFSVAATGSFAPSIADLAVGAYATGLRLADNTISVVGNMSAPTPTLTNVAEVALSNLHGCARRLDSTVWCWGNNSSGQLGNGTTTSSNAAVRVTGLSGVTTIAVGSYTSCASTANTTYCWGSNANGTIGDGTTTNRSVPVVVSGSIGGSTRITTGQSHTCAIGATDGIVRCWGANGSGQLGNGTYTNSLVPVIASGIGAGASIASSFSHTCATDAAGRAFCWGHNSSGQLGLGDTTRRPTATQIASLGSTVAEVTTMNESSCARTTNGDVYCWGNNAYGEVPDGTALRSLSPVLVLQNATQLRAGKERSACALHADNSVSCWGYNLAGQLGDSTSITRFTPVKMIN